MFQGVRRQASSLRSSSRLTFSWPSHAGCGMASSCSQLWTFLYQNTRRRGDMRIQRQHWRGLTAYHCLDGRCIPIKAACGRPFCSIPALEMSAEGIRVRSSSQIAIMTAKSSFPAQDSSFLSQSRSHDRPRICQVRQTPFV